MNPERELLWLRRLRDLTRSLAREAEHAGLIERILDAALELADAERGYVVLVDPGGDIRVRASRGIGKAELSQADHPSRRVVQRTLTGRSGLITSRDENADLLGVTSLSVNQVTSVACVPLRCRNRSRGVVYLETRDPNKAFDAHDLPILSTFADQAALALEFVEELAEPQPIVRRLIGSSLAMTQLRACLERVARSDELVLISGASGVGKELAARTLHDLSRPGKPFVGEACGALSPTLWESELFGHVRGAFSGAESDRAGLFELAEDGTLFLDEVADLPLALQAKLLRVLQEREVRPLGARSSVPIRARFVASTRHDLKQLVGEGSFREDLFYRLDVLRVRVPPLRERSEDIPELVEHFSSQSPRKLGISPRAVELLCAWHWPGNVRELENEVARLHAMQVKEITAPHLSSGIAGSRGLTRSPDLAGKTLGEAEQRLVEQALADAGGNKARAARLLGIPRTSIYRLMDRHGLR
jgi:transcriptional regulator with GAF, ATPase, and Fis domain